MPQRFEINKPSKIKVVKRNGCHNLCLIDKGSKVHLLKSSNLAKKEDKLSKKEEIEP